MFKEDCTFMTNAFWLVLNKVSLSNTRPTHYFLAKIAFLIILPINYLLTVMIKDNLFKLMVTMVTEIITPNCENGSLR